MLNEFKEKKSFSNEQNEKLFELLRQDPVYKMIVGKQVIWFEDKFVTRCEAQEPEPGKVDGAQALVHTDVLKAIKIKDLSKDPCADGNFLKECWNFCKPEERIIINEVIWDPSGSASVAIIILFFSNNE